MHDPWAWDWICSDDASLVGQILRNLVSNAVKYTRTGGVRLCCTHDAALVRIDVIDSGIGIPADDLPHIYDEFYQVGTPTYGSREGAGLGLSIVRRLVDLLMLKFDARSEVGRGSRFSLFLPASTRPVSTSRPATGRPAVSDLQHVQNGNGVDLLICDYHLEDGQSASDVIAMLREILGVSLRTIVVTGDTSSAIKQLPGDPHVRIMSKPIDSEELMTAIRSLAAS